MIRFLRSKTNDLFLVGSDSLFQRMHSLDGGYVARRDEDGKRYLVFDGNDPISTICIPIRDIRDLWLSKIKKLFYKILSERIPKGNYYHYIVLPQEGTKPFLVSYELGNLSLYAITPLPLGVGEDQLCFGDGGQFIRPC